MTNFSSVTITLKISDDISLAVLLHRDGTINRKGNGTEKIDNNFFIGLTKEPIFDNLIKSMSPDIEQYFNKVYGAPNMKGKKCELEIVWTGENNVTGTKFMYGTKSIGPPRPISDFVVNSIRLTDPWFHEQQKRRALKKAAKAQKEKILNSLS